MDVPGGSSGFYVVGIILLRNQWMCLLEIPDQGKDYAAIHNHCQGFTMDHSMLALKDLPL